MEQLAKDKRDTDGLAFAGNWLLVGETLPPHPMIALELATRRILLRIKDRQVIQQRYTHIAHTLMMKLSTVLFMGVLTTSSANGDTPPSITVPPDVQTSLENNAAVFDNVLLTGDKSRRFIGPPEDVLETLQTLESEAEFTQRLRYELRFQRHQFRESIEYLLHGSSVQGVLHEISFDGETFRIATKPLGNIASSSIHIHDPVKSAEYAIDQHDEPGMFDKMEFWYLFETGFAGPQTIYELGQPVESVVLHAAEHQEIVSVSEKEGNIIEVIIEQPEPWQSSETFDIETHQLYLDASNGSDIFHMRVERERRQLLGKHRIIRLLLNRDLGYAIEEKWESRKETGETMFHTRNSDFVQVGPDSVWMPRQCVIESHAYWTSPLLVSSDPLYETVIRMGKCELSSFDEQQFQVWYDTPGVSVSDWRVTTGALDDPETYRVPASIDELRNKRAFGAGWKGVLVVLNVLFIAGWLGWWYLRSRKKP